MFTNDNRYSLSSEDASFCDTEGIWVGPYRRGVHGEKTKSYMYCKYTDIKKVLGETWGFEIKYLICF